MSCSLNINNSAVKKNKTKQKKKIVKRKLKLCFNSKNRFTVKIDSHKIDGNIVIENTTGNQKPMTQLK